VGVDVNVIQTPLGVCLCGNSRTKHTKRRLNDSNFHGHLVGLNLHGQGVRRRAELAQVQRVRVALGAATPETQLRR
jgi:hypothetical protein